MSGNISDYLAHKWLDETFGGAAFAAPATLYIALFTVAPTNAGGGTEVPVANSYVRLAVTNNVTNFPNAAARAKSNGVAFTFATPTGAWGNVIAYGIFDASTAGNLLRWGTTPSKTIASGDSVKFLTGDLSITLNATAG